MKLKPALNLVASGIILFLIAFNIGACIYSFYLEGRTRLIATVVSFAVLFVLICSLSLLCVFADPRSPKRGRSDEELAQWRYNAKGLNSTSLASIPAHNTTTSTAR